MHSRHVRRFCTLVVLTCAALLFPSAAGAQPAAGDAAATATIRGSITTQTTIPLGGVMLSLNGGPDVVRLTSEGDGTYKFENLKPGRYTVTAAFEGFETITLPAMAVAGKVLDVPIDLQARGERHRAGVRGCEPRRPAGDRHAGVERGGRQERAGRNRPRRRRAVGAPADCRASSKCPAASHQGRPAEPGRHAARARACSSTRRPASRRARCPTMRSIR